MARMIDADVAEKLLREYADDVGCNRGEYELANGILKAASYIRHNIPTAYDVEKVVEEVKKLDLDGVSMVEDGKYKLVRKNEVISLIQTNAVCNGRHTTCADCYKMNCPLSTEKTFTDKWSEEVRKGGV